MKLIHVSDLHLTVPGTLIRERDPHQYCRLMIANINRHHADADLVIISGDLANDCDIEAYQALKPYLDALIPPYRLMMGNHDDRAKFSTVFPELMPATGFVQSSTIIGDAQIICLDTLQDGHVAGELCAQRLAWLEETMDREKALYIFMHHPPFPISVPSLDEVGLQNSDAFYAILAKHPDVRHIFAGHVHRPSSGIYKGIACSTVKSTCVQSALTFQGGFASTNEPPAYAIYLADHGNAHLHFHDFINGEALV